MDGQAPLPVTVVYDDDVDHIVKSNLSELRVTLVPSSPAQDDMHNASNAERATSPTARLPLPTGGASEHATPSLIPGGVLSYSDTYHARTGMQMDSARDKRSSSSSADTSSRANRHPRYRHHFEQDNHKEGDHGALEDAASGAVLIYPKRIDDFRRFRMLYVGLLLFISSSIQGVHPVFAVLLMEQKYLYTVEQLTNMYTVGAALGMFVLPFGAFYDWFGPRLMIMVATSMIVISSVLFGLMFGGHMAHTVTRSCIFYGLMSWGCYALDVVTLPTIMTHMPRDRSQPTGLLKTFSGLGASFLSCMYRGFFLNHFDHLMWFIAVLAFAIGVLGTLYLENAPYVVTRWQQRTLTPHEQLRCYLMRNRYMSQRVPQLRFIISEAILILLNMYMTGQAIFAGYNMSTLSTAQFRALAIVAILITVSTVVMALPFSFLDSKPYHDVCLIESAKEKEKRLLSLRQSGDASEQHRRPGGDGEEESSGVIHNPLDEVMRGGEADGQQRSSGGNDVSHGTATATGTHAFTTTNNNNTTEAVVMINDEEDRGAAPNAARDGVLPADSAGVNNRTRCSEPTCESEPVENSETGERGGREASINRTEESKLIVVDLVDDSEAPSHSATITNTNNNVSVNALGEGVAANLLTTHMPHTQHMHIARRAISTHDHPIVETITLCGEVYVVPLYQTTFLQSLTYLDLWLMFFTTMITWGVGLTLTANWNIEVMVSARDAKMGYSLYVLISSIAGVSLAGGRVSLALYEGVVNKLRDRGMPLTYTVGYTWPSIILLISTILWVSLPGNDSLIVVYWIGSFGYGFSTSMTIYLLQTIFDRDMGMHYGFCFTGAAIGIVFFFRLAWFIPYNDNAYASELWVGKRCVGERKCMQSTVIIYMMFLLVSIATSYIVHYRYSKLVEGKLKHRRVIVPAIRRLLNRF